MRPPPLLLCPVCRLTSSAVCLSVCARPGKKKKAPYSSSARLPPCVVSERSHSGIWRLSCCKLRASTQEILFYHKEISFFYPHAGGCHAETTVFTHALPNPPAAQCFCSGVMRRTRILFSEMNFSAKDPRVQINSCTRTNTHTATSKMCVCVCVCLLECVGDPQGTGPTPLLSVINVQSCASRSITPLSNNTSVHWIKIM